MACLMEEDDNLQPPSETALDKSWCIYTRRPYATEGGMHYNGRQLHGSHVDMDPHW